MLDMVHYFYEVELHIIMARNNMDRGYRINKNSSVYVK